MLVLGRKRFLEMYYCRGPREKYAKANLPATSRAVLSTRAYIHEYDLQLFCAVHDVTSNTAPCGEL